MNSLTSVSWGGSSRCRWASWCFSSSTAPSWRHRASRWPGARVCACLRSIVSERRWEGSEAVCASVWGAAQAYIDRWLSCTPCRSAARHPRRRRRTLKQAAVQSYSELLGSGRFGVVYRGTLPDNIMFLLNPKHDRALNPDTNPVVEISRNPKFYSNCILRN
jgi:hypothetical protein